MTFDDHVGECSEPLRLKGRFQTRRAGNHRSYVYLGGGLRFYVCDKLDIGFGARWAVTERSFERSYYTTEFRIRF